jgi:hypothetical protein
MDNKETIKIRSDLSLNFIDTNARDVASLWRLQGMVSVNSMIELIKEDVPDNGPDVAKNLTLVLLA